MRKLWLKNETVDRLAMLQQTEIEQKMKELQERVRLLD